MGKHDIEQCIQEIRCAAERLAALEPDRETLTGFQLSLSSCISKLAAHKLSLCPPRQHLSRVRALPDTFIRQVLAGLNLRDRCKLRYHAKRFLLCFPEYLRPSMEAWIEDQFVSRSQLSRGHLYLDLSMLLLQRRRLEAMKPFLKYAWGDSTLKKQIDIYNVRYRFFPECDAVHLARAWRWLCLHLPSFDDDEEMAEDISELRCLHSQKLFDTVEVHTQVPQLIGLGRAALVDKVGAHVHSTLLEAGDLQSLQESLHSCVAWCSDMGVEAGIPSCHVDCVETVLPAFARPSRIEMLAPDENGHVEEGQLYEEPRAPQRLMPNAVHVPGACHAIHNASANLDTAFSEFVEVVLGGTPQYKVGKNLFGRFTFTLYKERWGEVATYLREGFCLLVFLRQFWDEVSFMRGYDADKKGDSDSFKPQDVTVLLKDDFFFVYWQIQVHLRDLIQKLLRWCEGCACHSTLLQGVSPHIREKRMRHEVNCPEDVACHCPLMGCRAPEMVNGQLEEFAKQLGSVDFNKFVASCQVHLPVDSWAKLREEWERGVRYLVENLQLRLAFFKALPWVIIGGAHPDVHVARALLRRALELWEGLSEATKPLQHSKAIELFTGPLRDVLDAFLRGDDALEDYPLLERFLAPLSFVQIAERIIESAHKDMGAIPRNSGVTALSVQLRAPQLNRLLSLKPESFGDLVTEFGIARKIREFAKAFPCTARHPELLELQSGKRIQNTRFEKLARRIVYRDAMSQHADLSEAKAVLELSKKDTERVKRKLQQTESVSEVAIIADAATEHIRELCHADASTVISVGESFFMPILLHPARIRRPTHAPAAMPDIKVSDILACEMVNAGSPDNPVVSGLPDKPAATLNFKTTLEGMPVDDFLRHTRVWEKPGRVMLSLPGAGAEPSVVSAFLNRFVEEGAFPDSIRGIVPRTALESDVAENLAEQGFMEDSACGFALTQEGLSKLEFLQALGKPRSLCEPRPLPYESLSTFELLAIMKASGWVWAQLPSKAQARQKLVYKHGGPLEWFTAGKTVAKTYLLCLLNAGKLQTEHGIDSIPHALPSEAYEHILQGVPPPKAVEALRDKAKSKANKRLLDADVEVVDAEGSQKRALARLQPLGAKPVSNRDQDTLAEEAPRDGGDSFIDDLEQELEKFFDEEAEESLPLPEQIQAEPPELGSSAPSSSSMPAAVAEPEQPAAESLAVNGDVEKCLQAVQALRVKSPVIEFPNGVIFLLAGNLPPMPLHMEDLKPCVSGML
eukprot:s1685_g24.t1